jgi:hypothetical protein
MSKGVDDAVAFSSPDDVGYLGNTIGTAASKPIAANF